MPDDATLIDAVLAGRTDVFRALVERHQGPVFAVARSFALSSAHAEDIAQDTFLAAFANLRRFDAARGTFRVWVLAIARNRCRDLRRRRRESPTDTTEVGILPSGGAARGASDVRTALDGALAALPAARRVAFLLVEVYGLSVAEVASIEGVAEGTVKSRTARARAELRSRLDRLRKACDGRP